MDIQPTIPPILLLKLSLAVLLQKKRNFACDASQAVTKLLPHIEVFGTQNIPSQEPCLVVCNHYSSIGLPAWWTALALSAQISEHREEGAHREIYWVMTAAWTFPESRIKNKILTPLTRWLFLRMAMVYDFIPMPAMPPDPGEVNARAVAVIRSLRMAKRVAKHGGILALAPEGRDFVGGLGMPPEGAGEFIALLVDSGLLVLPVGIGEKDGKLRIYFGESFSFAENKRLKGYRLSGIQRQELDRLVIDRVMGEIAALLP